MGDEEAAAGDVAAAAEEAAATEDAATEMTEDSNEIEAAGGDVIEVAGVGATGGADVDVSGSAEAVEVIVTVVIREGAIEVAELGITEAEVSAVVEGEGGAEATTEEVGGEGDAVTVPADDGTGETRDEDPATATDADV